MAEADVAGIKSCRLISKEMLFEKRPPLLYDLYKIIVTEVARWGAFREETVPPDVIFLKTKSTFGAIKVKKDHLDVEFFLDHLEDIPPVAKYLQTSKRRFFHMVSIDHPDEIDTQLLAWLKASYDLIQSA